MYEPKQPDNPRGQQSLSSTGRGRAKIQTSETSEPIIGHEMMNSRILLDRQFSAYGHY
jgi:hypothetical protein